MNKTISAGCLFAAAVLVLAFPTTHASNNQFLDEFWSSERTTAPPGRPTASPPAAPPVTSTIPAPSPASGGTNLVPAVRGLPPTPGGSGTYRIAPGDLLKVEVFQVDELSSEERVSESGEIIMPLIGPVRIGGLTPKEAEAHIAAILGKDYLQNPQVDIDVTETAGRQITVMGAVTRPGVFPSAGRTTLLQAIALAEGTTRVANEEEVIVFRGGDGGNRIAYVVNLEAIKSGAVSDPILAGEDLIAVPKSGTRVFIAEVTDALRGFVRPFNW